MDLLILDSNFKDKDIIDAFESTIWTDRFNEYGDFEVVALPSYKLLSSIKKGDYLRIENSDHLMNVESIQIASDSEDGDKFIITGKSLEFILNRRIVWTITTVKAKAPDIIEKLLNENAISPSIEARKIPGLMFKKVDLSSYENMKEIEVQFYGESLYDCISTLCKSENLGFKITLDDDYNLVFELYEGVDRSYDQFKNDPMIFSPDFDNLIESDYIDSDANYSNVVLVAGEGEGSNRKTVVKSLNDKEYSGIDRREIFSDASDLSKTVSSGTLTDSEYANQLSQRGEETLIDCKPYQYFEGSIDSDQSYEYTKDFYAGDIIQIQNQYGLEAKARIVEIIISQDDTGFTIYPTIETME